MPTPNEIILSSYFHCGDEDALDALLAKEKSGTAIITSGPIPSLLKILVRTNKEICEFFIPNFNGKATLDIFFKFAKYGNTALETNFDELKSEMKSSNEPQKLMDTFLQGICVNYPMSKSLSLETYLEMVAAEIQKELDLDIIFKQRDLQLEKLVSLIEAEDYLLYHHPKHLMFCAVNTIVVTDEGRQRSISEPNKQGYYYVQQSSPFYPEGGPIDYDGLHTVANCMVVSDQDVFKKKYLQPALDKQKQNLERLQQAVNTLGNKKPLLEWKLNNEIKTAANVSKLTLKHS